MTRANDLNLKPNAEAVGEFKTQSSRLKYDHTERMIWAPVSGLKGRCPPVQRSQSKKQRKTAGRLIGGDKGKPFPTSRSQRWTKGKRYSRRSPGGGEWLRRLRVLGEVSRRRWKCMGITQVHCGGCTCYGGETTCYAPTQWQCARLQPSSPLTRHLREMTTPQPYVCTSMCGRK